MKKVIMVAVAVLSAWNVTADTEIVDGIVWHYRISDNVATVTGGELIELSDTEDISYGQLKGAIVIPSALGGCVVTSIGDGALWGCCGLTSVTVPKTIRRIGTDAFFGCSGYYKMRTTTTANEYTGECETVTVLLPDVVANGYSHEKIIASGGWITKITECTSSTASRFEMIFLGKTPENIANAAIPGSAIVCYRSGFGQENASAELTCDFSGDSARTFNGLVFDKDGVICGIVQTATGKATTKGVKVSGFVMLADGKKQSLKVTTVSIENGRLNVVTKVGKTDMALTIAGDGFMGTLGEMTVASATIGENTGVLSGTLKMSYFDAKTSKVKTKSIKLSGIALDGEAVGGVTVKGEAGQMFEAKIISE